MRRSLLSRFVLATFSGVILALAFPPYEFSLLAWLAFVPMLYAIEGCRPLKVLLIAWLQEFVFSATSGSWALSTLHEYAHLPTMTSVIEFLVLCLIHAAFGGCATALADFVRRRLSVPLALALPVTWTAGEWMRVNLPFTFPWNLLGYAEYRELALIQFAEFTGVYGISALIVFVNVCIYDLLFTSPVPTARRGILGSCFAILALAILFGTLRTRQVDSAPAAGRLRVALISGGIPAATVPSKSGILDFYRLETSMTLSQHPDLVIWPESAARFIFQSDGLYSLAMTEDSVCRRSLVEFAYNSATPILFGALAFQQSHGEVTMRNRAYLLSRAGEVAGYYDKLKLVPFGEYLPMRSWLAPHLRTIASIGEFASGNRDSLFKVDHVRLGVRICYESLFPDLMRNTAEAGADILINLSNDAWYGKAGAQQALAMTAMRAVETKRPVIRVANQGLSAIVSPAGRIQITSSFGIPARVVRDVGWSAGKTVYVRVGDVFAQLCVGLAAIGLVAAALMSSKEPANPND
ncbi:MAG: apolipoprotein N-acyltransferase [Candidatus Binataceae bacterium]